MGESNDISSRIEQLTLINYRENINVYFFLILNTRWMSTMSPWSWPYPRMKRMGRRLSDKYCVIYCHYPKWGEGVVAGNQSVRVLSFEKSMILIYPSRKTAVTDHNASRQTSQRNQPPALANAWRCHNLDILSTVWSWLNNHFNRNYTKLMSVLSGRTLSGSNLSHI